MSDLIAVIRIRGPVNINTEVTQTLRLLRLLRKHTCVVLKVKPETKGMLLKAKDYITWGEISEGTHKELIEKRGEKNPEGKLKPFFRLSPPRGGFERKGIKKPNSKGGALGARKDMDKLIKRMI